MLSTTMQEMLETTSVYNQSRCLPQIEEEKKFISMQEYKNQKKLSKRASKFLFVFVVSVINLLQAGLAFVLAEKEPRHNYRVWSVAYYNFFLLVNCFFLHSQY